MKYIFDTVIYKKVVSRKSYKVISGCIFFFLRFYLSQWECTYDEELAKSQGDRILYLPHRSYSLSINLHICSEQILDRN